MNDFILYFKIGLYHVLDINAYDHILFLIVLAVVYIFKQWKKVLWLITLFTIGHTLSLALSAYGFLDVPINIVEFLIPCTIFITGFMNVFESKKASNGKDNINLFFALFFGLIHGLGFSNYFRMMIGKDDNKFFPLIEFALGIEAAQAVIILIVLTLAIAIQSFFKINRRDWILVTSAIVIGIVIPMIINRVFW